jgi:hypothetical protein
VRRTRWYAKRSTSTRANTEVPIEGATTGPPSHRNHTSARGESVGGLDSNAHVGGRVGSLRVSGAAAAKMAKDLELNLAPLAKDGKVEKQEVDGMNSLWLQSPAEAAKEEKAR